MLLYFLWFTFSTMRFKDAILFIFFLFGLTCFAVAADKKASHKANISIPDVALLALHFEENSSVDFVGTTTSAGDRISLKKKQKSGVWLNYSSIRDGVQKRKITATVAGAMPEGLIVTVKAEESIGDGDGELGKSNGVVQLSETPSDIISGIGSCYTGSGVHNGHLLSYNVKIDEDTFFESQISEEAVLNIVYTLTDDN